VSNGSGENAGKILSRVACQAVAIHVLAARSNGLSIIGCPDRLREKYLVVRREVGRLVDGDMNERSNFGSLLRRRRERRGVTQRQLADLSTVSLRAIRNLELGVTRRPRIDTLRLIVDGLGLSPAESAELERAAEHPADGLMMRQAHVTRLPSALDRLIGRDDEVASIARALVGGQQRLHVLTGLGGIGKTRIAIEVANRLHRSGPISVLWTSDATQTPRADHVAQLVRDWLDGTASDEIALGKAFDGRSLVLVLDGFEPTPLRQTRLLELLWEYSDLQVLVTGRTPLDVVGEQVVPISPLEVADPVDAHDRSELANTAAMRLFVRTACLTTPDFRLDERTLPIIARLCHELDGVPGAVKAAAALLQIYEPHALAKHVADDLFGLVTGVISSSELIRMLDSDAGRILPLLAGLTGSWSMSDVVGLTGLPASRCAELVRRLLLRGVVRPSGRPGERRFRVLNLVRELCPRPVLA
jgi:transcriptional regulator with XRE-family HTH domain